MGDRMTFVKLKSITLDIREIPDMRLVELKKARRELRDIMRERGLRSYPHIRALTLLNTEIAVMEEQQ